MNTTDLLYTGWGGKIVNLSSQSGTPFKAAASCHPAMVDENDAPGITIPFAMLPSKDEPKEDVEKWAKAIKVKNIVEWFPNQVCAALISSVQTEY